MKIGLSLVAVSAAVALAGSAAAQPQNPPEVRRVVTKIDASGKAVVMFDGAVQLKSFRSPNPAGEMWVTDKSLPDFNWNADRALTKVGLVPPRNGTIFRIVDFAPLSPEAEKKMDINLMMKVVGDHAPAKGLPPRHPMMHRTRSLDYAIIMSGEIDMLLDDTEVHLKAGDVVVQQATNHAWVNRSGKPCRVAFILMDSQEP
jgi:mannose-6-phosphate isomerase-like protein (cupin superfamily)